MSIKILKPIDVPAGKVLQMWALPREGAPFPLGVIPARDKGSFTMSGTSEQLLSNVPRLAVSIEDAPARPGRDARSPSSSRGTASSSGSGPVSDRPVRAYIGQEANEPSQTDGANAMNLNEC